MEFLTGFVAPNLALLVGGGAAFALARRRPRTVFVVLAVLTVVGFVLLGYAACVGVAYNPTVGRIDFGSPAAKVAFRVGLPLAAAGTTALLVGLIPADPRRVGSAGGALKDVAVRVAVLWLGSGFVGFVLYTVLTGHSK